MGWRVETGEPQLRRQDADERRIVAERRLGMRDGLVDKPTNEARLEHPRCSKRGFGERLENRPVT
jgi:hypothetical protein